MTVGATGPITTDVAQSSTVSDLFLELHHRIEIMEEAVARKERKKRKELASHY